MILVVIITVSTDFLYHMILDVLLLLALCVCVCVFIIH